MKPRQSLIYLIIFTTIGRIIVASFLEFGNDEAYYYTYAQHLQWNYFDHPPGVAWLIRIFTLNLSLHNEIFVRLGSIVFAAVGTLFCYYIGKLIRNERTGWYAAILYNTSIYSSIIAGTFILPDSPQVVFWLASLYVMASMGQKQTNGATVSPRQWLWFGLLNGICIMCKVHGIFLWIGLIVYIFLFNRKQLLSPWLYLSLVITLICISPIFYWNMHNSFATWCYHSKRIGLSGFSFDKDNFIQGFFGQLFYNNPINVIVIVAALACYKKLVFLGRKTYFLLLLCGLPIIILTTGISLFRSILPHWSGPGFVTLSFVAAAYIDYKTEELKETCIHWGIKLGTGLVLLCVVGGIALIRFYPGTIGSKEDKHLGEQDFTLDMTGWRQFSHIFQPWFKNEVQKGLLKQDIEFVGSKWFPSAHVDYYIAGPLKKYVYGIGNDEDLHQYVWWNHCEVRMLQKGEDALCIVPSNYPNDPATVYHSSFMATQLLQTFNQFRGGALVRHFYVYLLKGYKGGDESSLFPVNL